MKLTTAAVVVTGIVILGCGSGAAGGDDAPQVARITAFEACKRSVLKQLKAPTTAQFRNPFQDDGEVTWSGSEESGPLVITSSVDSQNGFGAQLRSTWVCTATKTIDAGDDGWNALARLRE